MSIWRQLICSALILSVLGASAAAAASSGTDLPSSEVVQPQPPARSCHAAGTGAFSGPDLACTPGARNPAVTQSTIDSTICKKGYTTTVRPPVSVTRAEKTASLAAYGDSARVALRVRPSDQPRARRRTQRPPQPVARAGQDSKP
jgi:hypothetical protein